MRVGDLELQQQDLSPADWVAERLHDFAVDVGSVIPEGFAAYVRLIHPAARSDAGNKVPVSWNDVAAANGRVVHAEMQWANISGRWEHSGESVPGLWNREPEIGSLPREQARTLSEILRSHTSTPDRVWFCVWEGWGALRFHPTGIGRLYSTRRLRRRLRRRWRPSARRQLPPPAPRVQLPGRAYYLLAGPIDGMNQSMAEPPFWQSANLCWPDDRAWCVATEIDFSWTYVGGSDALAEHLVTYRDLEAMRTRIDHAITYDGDGLNPLPPA